MVFSHLLLNPSLEICSVIPKEGIVTLRAAELLVPGCKEPSTLVRSPTYVVLTQNEFCCKISFVVKFVLIVLAHMGGGSQKVMSDDEGEGGRSGYPPKMITSFLNSPLSDK